jgi:glycosyltransferase involved in cell wall biosynthesis
MTPKVSICMITYNHEKFIEQAIDSVLMQKTNFDYELVIGEDCSSDRTREIVIDYQKKFPDKIRLLLPRYNLGMITNFIQTLKACQGQYIALLEGDDYWTDPLKLKKQVDFLDASSEFVICFHNMMVKYEDESQKTHSSNINQKEVSTLDDLTNSNFIYTASCVFRNNLIKEFPEWFKEVALGDLPLFILLAQYGKIRFLNEIMGVYRVNNESVWAKKNELYKSSSAAHLFEKLHKHFINTEYCQKFEESALLYCYHSAILFESENDHINAKKYAIKCLNYRQYNSYVSKKKIFTLILKILSPSLYRTFKTIKLNI